MDLEKTCKQMKETNEQYQSDIQNMQKLISEGKGSQIMMDGTAITDPA